MTNLPQQSPQPDPVAGAIRADGSDSLIPAGGASRSAGAYFDLSDSPEVPELAPWNLPHAEQGEPASVVGAELPADRLSVIDMHETRQIAVSSGTSRENRKSDPGQSKDWSAAQALAGICEEFLRLTDPQHGAAAHSLTTAARILGKSPSWFSGADSMLARWRRGGVAGLMPQRSATGAKPGELSAALEALPWFIPAARHFYLLTNRSFDRGSVAEAIRRVASLPVLPVGWKESDKRRFLKVLADSHGEIPTFPRDLREQLIARERAGKPFVPQRIARQISLNPLAVRQYRNPKEAALDYLCAPGGMRLYRDIITGEQRLARAGEIIEADDATVNFPVCVPWNRDGSDDPCVTQYGVKVARFQWLVAIDAGTSFVPAFSYTARPRSSYRAEDVVSLLRLIGRQYGIPRTWRFERGVWESGMVTDTVRLMGSRLETVYSPHQKPFIEGLFNTLWTKLSVHFPGAHVGRFRGEEKGASDLLTACQRGHKDPRRYFPMLATAIAAFREVIAEKNRTPVTSESHGRWIPEERWQLEHPQNMPALDGNAEWMFSPFRKSWKIKGMIVGGRVPVFEDVSVPFDFSAPWLPNFDGARVKCHFDPADPKCAATLVLEEPWNGRPRGSVLGLASQIGSMGAYVRLVMGWGEDPMTQGAKARQQAAAQMRREVRAVMPRGQRGQEISEERDGLGASAKVEVGGQRSEVSETAVESHTSRDSHSPSGPALADRLAATQEFFRQNALENV